MVTFLINRVGTELTQPRLRFGGSQASWGSAGGAGQERQPGVLKR